MFLCLILVVHGDSVHTIICTSAPLPESLHIDLFGVYNLKGWFFPSTMSVLGLELRLPGLAASARTL